MNSQSGITLVEVAISVAIIGILMSGALELQQRARAQRQFESTYDNMDTIIQALSIYVETAGRLPCPADPAVSDASFGWERGVKAAEVRFNHPPTGSCDAKTRDGIVPFMTIGLPVQTARDGWGNFYTYAVSPVFTRQNDQTSKAADTGKVHGRCRHAGWVNVSDRYNRNAIKARFCCADHAKPVFDVDSDLIILHTNGGAALSPVRTLGTLKNYDDLTKTTTYQRGDSNVPFMDTTPIEAPALVLVSHGLNGKGAWLGNGTNNRLTPPASGPEWQNADGDQIFVDGPWNLKPGPAYFDDIVRWMTQDGIMAAHGALSCSYP
jgi:prepilin-type N-terminal cleavage/methylation domain-containing protein